MTEKLSECCGAEVEIYTANGTYHEGEAIFLCSKCGKPCTIAKPEKTKECEHEFVEEVGSFYRHCKLCGISSKPQETPASQQPENALLKALNTIDKLPVGKFVETQPDASPDQPNSERLLTADEVSMATTWKIDWVKSRMRLINRILRSQRDLTASLKDGEIASRDKHWQEVVNNTAKTALESIAKLQADHKAEVERIFREIEAMQNKPKTGEYTVFMTWAEYQALKASVEGK